MARTAYIAEIDPREVAALAYVAGMLQGQGVPQGQIIANVLDRIQLVEVPDEFGLEGDVEASPEGDEAETEGTVVELFPEDEGDAEATLDGTDNTGEVLPENSTEPHGGELPHIDPTKDPTAPENLNIELNLPNPYGPPPVQTFGNQDDFGAGPPPRSGS